MMTTSTELHHYERDHRVAKVFRSYEGHYVEFFENQVMVERRELYKHTEQYAEDAAENWVDKVI